MPIVREVMLVLPQSLISVDKIGSYKIKSGNNNINQISTKIQSA